MVITLSREDIEKAILDYVRKDILAYSVTDTFEVSVTQGKSASAKVEFKKLIPISE